MGFDPAALRSLVASKGRVARVVVADLRGSAPRETGAAMLVWAEGAGFGQAGTIGGGALEWEAARVARAALDTGGGDRLDTLPLGPALGQCCGGAVDLLTELFDAARLEAIGATDTGNTASREVFPKTKTGLEAGVFARPLPGRAGAMPLTVARRIARARAQGQRPETGIVEGWMVEPLARPDREVWIWGAGHVGRALVEVLAPLPGMALTWVDTGPERFPDRVPPGVTVLPAATPARLVPHAPARAEHLVLTYSHALDLELCHALLSHGFRSAGLIGSATKRARFRARLAALGHGEAQIARIACPIGDPSLGKHPQAIAVGVAAGLLRGTAAASAARDMGT